MNTGDSFGRLTAIKKVGSDSNRNSIWMFSCSCGNDKNILANAVKAGSTTSCGCRKKEGIATRHGMCNSPSYKTWKAMKARCLNPSDSGYEYYGGRGITVCDDWLQFEGFYESMGDRPDGHTIERINNNKGYSPENCEWTTHKENCRNTRKSRSWVVFGKKYKSLNHAANDLGYKSSKTIERMCKGYTRKDTGRYYPPKEGCYVEDR